LERPTSSLSCSRHAPSCAKYAFCCFYFPLLVDFHHQTPFSFALHGSCHPMYLFGPSIFYSPSQPLTVDALLKVDLNPPVSSTPGACFRRFFFISPFRLSFSFLPFPPSKDGDFPSCGFPFLACPFLPPLPPHKPCSWCLAPGYCPRPSAFLSSRVFFFFGVVTRLDASRPPFGQSFLGCLFLSPHTPCSLFDLFLVRLALLVLFSLPPHTFFSSRREADFLVCP